MVHLHSLHAVAVSCLAGLDAADVFPPITAYAVMQVGKLALVPYYPPGDQTLADAVRKLAGKHHAGTARESRPRGRGQFADGGGQRDRRTRTDRAADAIVAQSADAVVDGGAGRRIEPAFSELSVRRRQAAARGDIPWGRTSCSAPN